MFLYQPKRPDRRIKMTRGTPRSNQSQSTLEHLTNGWIPVNAKLLEQIREKTKQRQYRDNPEELIKDLKSDPALFFFCVRNLRGLIDTNSGINPIEELKKLEDEKLADLFSTKTKEISIHKFQRASKMQAKQLSFSICTSNAAETIALQNNLEADLAFSSASFRQLGLYLISWNYPKIYARVLSAHRLRDADIDFELTRLLGISPSIIGRRYAADWGINADLRRTINEGALETNKEQSQEEQASSMTVQEICEVSELYAKTKDPDTYPKAEEIWIANESKISSILDDETIKIIEEKVKETTNIHQEELEIYKTKTQVAVSETRQQEITQTKQADPNLIDKNSYLQKIPTDLVAKFTQVYEKLNQTAQCIDAIRILVDWVIPKAGFSNGCFYIFDSETFELSPALRIGNIPLSAYRTLLMDSRNSIKSAMHSNVPLKYDGMGVTGEPVTQICGAVTSISHPGILYLEIKEEYELDPEYNANHHFQAVRQALIDCFKSA